MQLGLSTYTYTWAIGVPGNLPAHPLTAFDLLFTASRLGVKWVQFADNLPLASLSSQDLSEIAALARQLNIRVEVGTRGIGPDHLSRYLDLSRMFNSPILRVVVDSANYHPTPDEVVKALVPFKEKFMAAGVILAIENHDRFSCETLAEIVRRLGADWVGICLDTVNSFGALEGPKVVVDILGPLTVNLHIKDFTISRASHMMGFNIEGCPAGQGRLDVKWLLDRLQIFGRDPNAILELWTPPEVDLDATIAKESHWAEESVVYLRTLIPD